MNGPNTLVYEKCTDVSMKSKHVCTHIPASKGEGERYYIL